jgi:hypothetical protein
VSAFVAPEPGFSLGLLFEHARFGRERSAVTGAGAAEVTRDLNALWAALRLSLARGELAGLGLSFGPGLAWQRLDATGVTGLLGRPTTFACSGSAGAGLGLRAGLDGWLALGGGLALVGGAGTQGLLLSSDILDSCAPGAGSALLLGVQAGLAYRFDVRRYVVR